jgi:hypothetical protein
MFTSCTKDSKDAGKYCGSEYEPVICGKKGRQKSAEGEAGKHNFRGRGGGGVDEGNREFG